MFGLLAHLAVVATELDRNVLALYDFRILIIRSFEPVEDDFTASLRNVLVIRLTDHVVAACLEGEILL